MKTKRMTALLMALLLLTALLPQTLLPIGAVEVMGDWTTYRFAYEYPDPNEPYDPWDETIYRPEAGYQYTEEGFSTIAPSYEETTPSMTVITKEKQSVKDGIYLQFRVDDFSYDGGTGKDEWIALTLTTEGKVAPGHTAYGGGWMTLIRGRGDGNSTMMPHLTDPKTNDFDGMFTYVGMGSGAVPLDDQGREIYTLEVTWNGREYEMKINGVVQPGTAQTTALLNKLDSDGEFYVGINIQSAVKDGTCALTILKYGTCEEDAVTPVGSDYKAPEANEFVVAEVEDPDTVSENQPAILWSPETYDLRLGENVSFTVSGDDTWRGAGFENYASWVFKAKNSWSYAAEDFPVFGMLLRNVGDFSGVLAYAAGEVDAYWDDYSVDLGFGTPYGEDGEYVFVPVDMTDLWHGRIKGIMLGLSLENREFDICFAGMFRSEDEAYTYAENYLTDRGISVEKATEAPVTTESPETHGTDSEPESIHVWIPNYDSVYIASIPSNSANASGALFTIVALLAAVICMLQKSKE